MIVLWRKGELPRIDANLCFFVVLPIVLLQAFFSGLLTSFVLLCAFLVVILYSIQDFEISGYMASYPRYLLSQSTQASRGAVPTLGVSKENIST
jgi:hypothetical protein